MTKTMKLTAADVRVFLTNDAARKLFIRSAEAEAEACYKHFGEACTVELVSPSGRHLHSVEAS